MSRKNRVILGISLIIVLVIGLLMNQFAPPLAQMIVDSASNPQADCLTDGDGVCVVLPTVTGIGLDNQAIAIPAVFTKRYQLIVMPFDRDQQVDALTWLPIFQSIATENPNVDYFSIAALPDLAPAIRLLVIAGLNTGIADDTIRERVVLLFLPDQEAFLQALNLPDAEQIRVLIMDQDGIVYYQDAGLFTDDAGDALREAFAKLP